MREAAFEIASMRADWAPSLLERAVAALARLLRRRAAARAVERLRELEIPRLADIGLVPSDLVGLPGALAPDEATRRLARTARARIDTGWARARAEADLADRWQRDVRR